MLLTPHKPAVESPFCSRCGGFKRSMYGRNRHRLGVGGMHRVCCCGGCTCGCATTPDLTISFSGFTGCCFLNWDGKYSLFTSMDDSIAEDTLCSSPTYPNPATWKSEEYGSYNTTFELYDDAPCSTYSNDNTFPDHVAAIECSGDNEWRIHIYAGSAQIDEVNSEGYGWVFRATYAGDICGKTLVLSNDLVASDCGTMDTTTPLCSVPLYTGGAFSGLDNNVFAYGGSVTITSTCP